MNTRADEDDNEQKKENAANPSSHRSGNDKHEEHSIESVIVIPGSEEGNEARWIPKGCYSDVLSFKKSARPNHASEENG